MKRLRAVLALLLIPALLLIAGCTDIVEINRRVLVFAIGLDAGPGAQDLEVTIQYLVPKTAADGGNGGGRHPQAVTLSATALSLRGGIQALTPRVPGNLFLGSVRLILIGEELARRGFSPALDYLMRQPLLPISALSAMVAGRAGDFLRAPAGAMAASAAQHLIRLLDGGDEKSSVALNQPLWRLWNQSVSPTGAGTLPMVTSTPEGPAITAVAFLRQDRLKRSIALADAPLITARYHRGTAFFELPPLPGTDLPLVLRFLTLRTTARLDGGSGRVQVRLQGQAFLVEGAEVTVLGREGPALTEHVNRVLGQRLRGLLAELYGAGLDVLDLGETERRRTAGGKVPDDWAQRLPEFEFIVEPRIVVVHGQRGP